MTFDVLSDVGNHTARRFGLVYALPEELRAALRSNNKALPGINGDESWELPVPATYVIARDGRVVLAYIGDRVSPYVRQPEIGSTSLNPDGRLESEAGPKLLDLGLVEGGPPCWSRT